MFADIAQTTECRHATETKVDIEVTPIAVGLQMLIDSGLLDLGAGRELPTSADADLVADIYHGPRFGGAVKENAAGTINPRPASPYWFSQGSGSRSDHGSRA